MKSDSVPEPCPPPILGTVCRDRLRFQWPALLFAALIAFTGQFSTAVAQPEVVAISAVAAKTTVRPNDQLAIAVILDHEDGWHSHTNDPVIPATWGDFTAIPTTVEIASSPAVSVGPIQWPKGHAIALDLAATGLPVPYEVFEGRAVIFVPVIVAPGAPIGEVTLTISVRFQACDETTCMLQRKVDVPVVLTVGDATGSAAADASLFTGFDQSVFARMLSGERVVESVKFNFFGRSFSIDPHGVGILLLLLVAALGGALLNLTPCVLPVIPIKIMSLSAAAGNPKRCLFLGFIMSLGVVAFWLAIGGAIAFISGFNAINQLFQIPWFSIGVGVFIAAMGIGMMGLFTINLPQFVYMLDPKRESATGSFIFGIMTAVLSTPCTAPFMGTAAAWAAKQPPLLTMATFATIGAGMAIPYLVLAANPKWVAKVPRTGPMSNLVKQIMGLLMLAVAVFFIGTGIDPLVRLPVDPAIRFYWWIVAAIVVAAAGWCIVRIFRLSLRTVVRGVVVGFALLAAAGSLAAAHRLTDHGPINWVGYTPERFAQATGAGKVIVLDFTAEWCLNCKALENGVLHREAVYERLNADDVAAFRVDLTGDNPDGQAKLSELNWVGIPLLAIYGPVTPEPSKFDTYTPETVLGAIAAAKGGG